MPVNALEFLALLVEPIPVTPFESDTLAARTPIDENLRDNYREWDAKALGGLTLDQISQELNVSLGSRVTTLARHENTYYTVTAVEAPKYSWHKQLVLTPIKER